ncbi:MAG: hypothetical protein NTY65_09810 [Planctomycetota bacterium]|nr:hypothetical protein [Planctomycetota bacterium]
MPRLHLCNADKDLVGELYAQVARTVDDLPYTDEFERLHAEFMSRTGRQISHHDFWRALSSARKATRLIRKER